MNHPICHAGLLFIATLAPAWVSAALVDFSVVEITAFASFDTQGQPQRTDFDGKVAPPGPTKVEALVRAGIPFPNLPNSVGSAFASSAGDANGIFGVGVNGFFLRNSLPPNALVASGTSTQTITNNSNVTLPFVTSFFIPAPTFQFFGNIGDFFPGGVDPARDATARVSARIVTKVTRPDGSVTDDVLLDYGMTLFRDPDTGILGVIASPDAGNLADELVRFEEPDGSFGFQLSDLAIDDFALGDVGPGDILEFSFDYFASASTGFGETGIFAAIGDPFDLSAGGGRFELQVGAISVPVPEPSTYALLAAGLLVVGLRARTRAALLGAVVGGHRSLQAGERWSLS